MDNVSNHDVHKDWISKSQVVKDGVSICGIMTEKNGEVELTFSVTGLQKVPVTIELCFNEGGQFTGLTTDSKGKAILARDNAIYEVNGEQLQFGPGSFTNDVPENLEGERYSTHFGTLKTSGKSVYLTGVTPFKHTLFFR